MLKVSRLGTFVATLLWTSLAFGQSPSVPPHSSVRIPARPAALFSGEQGRQRTEIHFDPVSSTVTMKLLVQDPAGYFIPNLHRDNFVVYENGNRQQNATVEIEHAPIALGIVMEHGGHFKGFNRTSSDEILGAGQQILGELGRDDRVAVWEYADQPQEVADFTTDHSILDSLFMSREVPDSSETNFYDALVSASETMKPVTGRKALIVITPGVDTFSKAQYTDALNAVRASGTPVYVIDVGPDLRDAAKNYSNEHPYGRLDWNHIEGQLREIANVSGGRLYPIYSVLNLTALYDDLMENLRVRYVITYRSSTNDPIDASRTVRVELVDPQTNSPLEIVDTNGKVIRSKVIVENSYAPAVASAKTQS